jgi:hypothetical protein
MEYSIQRAQQEYDTCGIISQCDGDAQAIIVFEGEHDEELNWPLIILDY